MIKHCQRKLLVSALVEQVEPKLVCFFLLVFSSDVGFASCLVVPDVALVNSDFRQHAPLFQVDGPRRSFGIIPENKLGAQIIVRKTFCVPACSLARKRS